MEFQIVDVNERHLARIHRIEEECFSMPWTPEQLAAQRKDGQHEFIAAVGADDVPIGYVGMMYVLDEGYISNVAVDKPFRRQGIADALIEALTRRACELKLAFLTLEVRAGNEPAIRLYEKHGFVPVGRRKNYYEQPREDALLMTRFLN